MAGRPSRIEASMDCLLLDVQHSVCPSGEGASMTGAKRQRVADYTDAEKEQFYRDGKPGIPLYRPNGSFRMYIPWTRIDRAYFEQRLQARERNT
jgi:hypothetical protein